MPDKASVAVAIIARNAGRTIGACLDSIVPYVEQVVVAVDRTTTDETANIAREHGAEVHEGLAVSEWHECPMHGRVLAQHFAKARDISFSYLRRDVDWHFWLDSDDTVVGAEKLAAYLAKMPSEVAAVWMPYHYATAGTGGPTTTLFDRERLVRASLPWQWQYRVHEILTPVGKAIEEMPMVRTEEIYILHQGEGHDTAGSARRNITLLEIDLEENSEDMRAWFYLGNQYFALADWGPAIEAYERSLAAQNPYQLWQTLLYLAMSYQKIGDIGQARQACWRAIDIQPNHPEPYYQLASTYMMAGDVGKAEFWTRFGDQRPPPPFYVFKNPLDKPYNARLTLATAYANAGETSKALRELRQAASVISSKEILDGIAFHEKLEEDTATANAWLKVLPHLNGHWQRGSIPDDIWRFGRVRDAIVPRLLDQRTSPLNTQPRIIFWCGHPIEPWAPPVLDTTGIGGSETAVIQIAKRFARDGWRVDVYNDCDKYEGEYEGVGYWDCRRLNQAEQADVLVSWRNPAAFELPVQREMSLLWCHDLNNGPNGRDYLAKWDVCLAVSGWHAAYLSQLYGGAGNFGYVPNGIDLERFAGPELVKKVAFRCVYASSPDRGLPNLLRMWPEIVAAEPTAELHIAYGWDTIDKTIAMGHQDMARLKAETLALLEKTPNVVWRGRLSQPDLARLYQESYLMLYPTSFTETFCIGVLEAMAGGCTPVTSAAGALPETIGDGGLIVTGNTYSQAWKEFWIQCAKAALLSPTVRLPFVQRGLERVKGYTWDASFDVWRTHIEQVRAKKKEMVTA